MKTLKLFVIGLLIITSAQAQVSVNVNLGTPPVWAPANAVATQYYYLPDVDMYYDVPAQRFLYVKNGKWIRAERLPTRYSGYNLRNGNVVYLTDYRGSTPYVFHKNHKVRYVGKKYHPTKMKAKQNNGKHKGHKKNHKKDK